ncbi:MAG: hypothetical protein KDB68_03365 [Planctomycetes bacterium]|nr:hypothetical protein [Planctomycetota bacterium]MCA8935220.1 hypothetical protein [Planctomycetota bacterium]
MRVLWVLVLLLLSAPAFGEVYSHPNPKFQITIPDGYLRLSRPQGMADAHCVFGKNHHEGVNDIIVAVSNPHFKVPPNVTVAPDLPGFSGSSIFKVLSKSTMGWNGTSVATYVVELRDTLYGNVSEPYLAYVAFLPASPEPLSLVVYGLYGQQSELAALLQQLVGSVVADGPGTQPISPQAQPEASQGGMNVLFIIVPLLVVVGGGAAVFFVLRANRQPPAPAYTPPPNAYRDMAPGTQPDDAPLEKPERAPWEQ